VAEDDDKREKREAKKGSTRRAIDQNMLLRFVLGIQSCSWRPTPSPTRPPPCPNFKVDATMSARLGAPPLNIEFKGGGGGGAAASTLEFVLGFGSGAGVAVRPWVNQV